MIEVTRESEMVNIENDGLNIKNVPIYLNEFVGPNGENYQMSMGVARNLSLISEYMRENQLMEFDYREWESVKN